MEMAIGLTADQIDQAIIGFGSAVIGALVGGVFVLLGARGQWTRDRKATAHQAAQRILVSLVPLEGVFATLGGGADVNQADAASAFNNFSTATVSDLPFIPDDRLTARVLAHRELCFDIIQVGLQTVTPSQAVEVVRRHSDAVTRSLHAYIRGQKLPADQPLPRKPSGVIDPMALLSWAG